VFLFPFVSTLSMLMYLSLPTYAHTFAGLRVNTVRDMQDAIDALAYALYRRSR